MTTLAAIVQPQAIAVIARLLQYPVMLLALIGLALQDKDHVPPKRPV